MKTKSISFAEVLRKNVRSPRVEQTMTGVTLEEMVRRFEAHPQEDYTLYLGNFSTSQRSKPASSRLTFSRNTVGNQEEMFDSWIKKQSTLGSNKENIRNQSQRTTRNEPQKRFENGFQKGIVHSKNKQNPYPLSSNSSNRQRETLQTEESQNNFPTLYIEMIKSNGYEGEQGFNRCRSPQNLKKNQPPPPPISLDHERPKFSTAVERPIQVKAEPTFKEIKESKQSEKIQSQFTKIPEKFNNNPIVIHHRQSFQAQSMRESISDITSKYLNANYSPEGEDEQLLLEEEVLLRPQDNEQSKFNENYAKKAQKHQQIQKKRMEEAKNMIGNILGKYKKEEEEKKDDFFIPNNANQNYNNKSNQMVGYSFSNNFLGVNQSVKNEQHQETYIPQAVSQAPDEIDQQMSDSTSFKNKYLNLQSFEIQHNEHIQNIQSVKYEGDNHALPEEERPYGVPNDTFKIQLISSKNKYNNFGDKYQYRQTSNQVSFKEENHPSLSIQSRMEIEVKQVRPLGKSKQKISLISSKSRSNKTSPTTTKPQKEPQVATTDFTLNLAKQEKQTQVKIAFGSEIKPQEASNSYKSPQTYQSISKIGEDSSKAWQSYKYAPNNISKTEPPIVPITIPSVKIQETSKYQYQAPTYAKNHSKKADITFQYYSSPTYTTQYTPSYQIAPNQAPSYGNHSKMPYTSPKNYDNLPLKVQTPYTYDIPKQQPKRENVSYQPKYALPTNYTGNVQGKKSYLSQLQIKQSITIDEPKQKQQDYQYPSYNPIKNSNSNFSTVNNAKQLKTVNPTNNSRNSLKLSLKQSINVCQSEEFMFDL